MVSTYLMHPVDCRWIASAISFITSTKISGDKKATTLHIHDFVVNDR